MRNDIDNNKYNLEKAECQGQRLSSYASSSSSSSTKKQPHKTKSSLQSQHQQSHDYLNTNNELTINDNSPKRLNTPAIALHDSSNCKNKEFQMPAAPTLPLHSPHSPLHPNMQVHQQNKLSARYINNAANLDKNKLSTQSFCNCKSNKQTNDTSSINVLEVGFNKKENSMNSSSAFKLICSCEHVTTNDIKPLQKSSNLLNPFITKDNEIDKNNLISTTIGVITSISNANAKRIVTTRNAATSPNLDLRKLGGMTTVLASFAQQQANPKHDQNAINELSGNSKQALEKSNSLGETKPQKYLRNALSLSPRPPIKHQTTMNDLLVNELLSVRFTPAITTATTRPKVDISSKLMQIPNKIIGHAARESEEIRRKKHLQRNTCKSEQTSPNITDIADLKFNYNQATNKSTGCLVYVPTDPWLKMSDLENFQSKTNTMNRARKTKNKNEDKMLKHEFRAQTISDNIDPWVKRTEIPFTRSPKQERFRQAKSFSASKFTFEDASIDNKQKSNRPKLQRCKSPILTDECILGGLPLQSAPSSPHYAYNIQQSTSPSRSASFSPARAKDYQNPFIDNMMTTNLLKSSPPPSVSVASASAANNEITTAQKKNLSYLNVCDPNFLQARHSFSSVINNQQMDDELQLNIRRLSEQMRKSHNSLGNAAKISHSDRNVTNHFSELNYTSAGADFSDYLKQFRCSEAKKAAANTTNAYNSANIFVTSTSDVTNGCATTRADAESLLTHHHKSKTKSDSLLETTC